MCDCDDNPSGDWQLDEDLWRLGSIADAADALRRKMKAVSADLDAIFTFAHLHGHHWPDGEEHSWKVEAEALDALLAQR